MTTPTDLKYTEAHAWVKQEPDGTLSVGITFHAQDALGDVVFVEIPAPGRKVKQGEACGVIESVKTASDVHAPLTGEIVAANDELADAPEKLNQDPYGAWMFRMKPADPGKLAELLDASSYDQFTAADKPH